MTYLTKGDLAKISIALGHSSERFERQWAEFVEFRDLVEWYSEQLRIPRPSAQFSAFGLAMLDAKTLGELNALETML